MIVGSNAQVLVLLLALTFFFVQATEVAPQRQRLAITDPPPSPTPAADPAVSPPQSTSTCCDDCSKCPYYPMCQPQCTNPPRNCDFYDDCLEASIPCGSNGYALEFGEPNCLQFLANIDDFTSEGQAFVYATMSCLQRALIPYINCDETCAAIQSTAFASHPSCYISSGFCELSSCDLVEIFETVG